MVFRREHIVGLVALLLLTGCTFGGGGGSQKETIIVFKDSNGEAESAPSLSCLSNDSLIHSAILDLDNSSDERFTKRVSHGKAETIHSNIESNCGAFDIKYNGKIYHINIANL
jgi:hypothetical protein